MRQPRRAGKTPATTWFLWCVALCAQFMLCRLSLTWLSTAARFIACHPVSSARVQARLSTASFLITGFLWGKWGEKNGNWGEIMNSGKKRATGSLYVFCLRQNILWGRRWKSVHCCLSASAWEVVCFPVQTPLPTYTDFCFYYRSVFVLFFRWHQGCSGMLWSANLIKNKCQI